MAKRQLESKYKKLVDYINSNKDDEFLFQLLSNLRYRDTAESVILDELNNGWATNRDFDNLIPIITDIYFDNYELQQPKHMYCLSGIRSLDGPMYVTFKNECYTLSIYAFTNDDYQSLTDTQFQEFLNQHSKFSADMFEKMEV
ncbi:hypothetical protein [Companilactobacillus zhachilii]|uniref:hypothetical protein n=1 Tax=Companilactobacillus zhachilii TaxID=2304606 RepID=UPI004033D615